MLRKIISVILIVIMLVMCIIAGKNEIRYDAVEDESLEVNIEDAGQEVDIVDSSLEACTVDGSLEADTEDENQENSQVTTAVENAEVTTEEDNPEVVPKPEISTKVKGIYVTGPVAGTERFAEIKELVDTTELNTMVIDIKNDEGILTYDIDVDAVKDMDASIKYVKDMPGLIDKLHSDGIYVIGRIVCFKDPILAEHNPDLALVTPEGKAVMDANGLAWVNPYREEVWDYLCTIAEQATSDGFDEIQFDYVRFPIGEDANNAIYGVDMAEYSRQQGLTAFFEYAADRLHRSEIIYGADLFGTVIGSDTDRDRTGQDYEQIVHICDNVCPMVYPSHYAGGTFGFDVPDAHPYETVYNAMSKSVEVIGPEAKDDVVIRPWLQCFNAVWVSGHITYDSEQIKEQIQAVYDAGYDEWILWNASNHYDQVANALN